MTKTRAVPLRYRLAVASRVLAAVAGGYAVAVLVAVAGAWALPMARFEAVMAGTMLALLALPVAAMACFSARTPARAWAGIVVTCVALAGIAMAGGWRP